MSEPETARQFVPKTQTVVTMPGIAAGLSAAWAKRGRTLTARELAIVFGKLCMECGWPGAHQSCWNWNFGNIRGASPAGRFTVLAGAWERSASGEIYYPPDQRFCAFEDIGEACEAWLRLLETRYAPALERLFAGDSAGFVRALKAGGYMTGDVAIYARTVGQIADSTEGQAAEALAELNAAPTPEPGLVLGGDGRANPIETHLDEQEESS